MLFNSYKNMYKIIIIKYVKGVLLTLRVTTMLYNHIEEDDCDKTQEKPT